VKIVRDRPCVVRDFGQPAPRQSIAEGDGAVTKVEDVLLLLALFVDTADARQIR
jgi:hypothetical protein